MREAASTKLPQAKRRKPAATPMPYARRLCGGLGGRPGAGRRVPGAAGAGGVAQDGGDGFGRVVRQAARRVVGGAGGRGHAGGVTRTGTGSGRWGSGSGRGWCRASALTWGLRGAGLAGRAGGGGAGAELADVVRRAALEGAGAGEGREAEVTADFGDDVGGRAACDVSHQVRLVGLDRKQAAAAPVYDGLADRAPAERCVAGDDSALQRQTGATISAGRLSVLLKRGASAGAGPGTA